MIDFDGRPPSYRTWTSGLVALIAEEVLHALGGDASSHAKAATDGIAEALIRAGMDEGQARYLGREGLKRLLEAHPDWDGTLSSDGKTPAPKS
jgi:hypothetical protein